VTAARLELQRELGRVTEPSWPVAIEALAPKHVSLLDPRGTWQSITEIPSHAAELERHALLRGPLRLAVLANGDARQVESGEPALERWLRPERRENVACPSDPPVAARPAEYEVDPSSPSSGSVRAIVAVPISPAPGGGVPIEAEWTAELLNRDGGWLDHSLRASALALSAEATVLGGREAGALAVELVATTDKLHEAVAQTRAVLARLSEGAATPEDLSFARSAFDRARVASSVDPRHRIVGLWLGARGAPAPTLLTLRAFHHDVLGPDHHVVVVTKIRP
jgi:hypothetical protein